MDRGYIRTHGRRRRERISEIEIELKSGDPGELPKIATKLAHSVATSYAPRSKADRGYALICQSADAADPGREMDLDAHSAAGAAFRLIGLSCLDHATANERAIRHGDPEGIHQMGSACGGCAPQSRSSRRCWVGRKLKHSSVSSNG